MYTSTHPLIYVRVYLSQINHRAHIFFIRYSIQGMVVITLIYFFLIKPL